MSWYSHKTNRNITWSLVYECPGCGYQFGGQSPAQVDMEITTPA
jgi:hypothetical protein